MTLLTCCYKSAQLHRGKPEESEVRNKRYKKKDTIKLLGKK